MAFQAQATIDRWAYPEDFDMPEEFLEIVELFQRYRGDEFRFLREVALFLASRNGEVCADDLYEVCNFFNINKDRRIIGGVLGKLKHDGLLIPVRIGRTARKEAHGRPIWIYSLPGVRQ